MKNRFYIVLVVFASLFAGVTNLAAQAPNPPESLLPAPGHNQDKVLSFFCDHYTAATTFTGITSSSAATKRELTNVLNNQLIYIEGGLNSWEHIGFNTAVDISTYDSISFDVYVVKSAFDLKVQLGTNSTGIVVLPKLQEGWNRVKVKLANFKFLTTPPDLTVVNQISFINNAGYARTIYIDNIYVFGSESDSPLDPQLPAQLAPEPTRDDADVKSIFSDAYTGITTINSFSGTGLGKILPLSAQSNIIKIENGLNNWANIHFNTIDINDKDSLHIDIFVVRESGTIDLKFRFDDGIGVEQVLTLNPGWNFIDLKLADFKNGSTLNAITQLKILRIGGYPQNVFIDNIYTYGTDSDPVDPDEDPVDPTDTVDPNAPAVSAPTPIHPQEDVRAIFSNHYTSVATLSQTNPGLPVSEMKTIKTTYGDEMIRFVGMNWTLLKIDPAFNIDDMDFLHIDIYAEGTPRLVFGLGDGFNEKSIPEQNLEAGWKSFDIPVSLFRDSIVDLSKLTVLRMFSKSGFAISKMYFDNIYAFRGDPSGNPPTFEIPSAPEPIMAKNTVKSIYTDKYISLTELDIANTGTTTKFRFQKLTDTDMVLRMRSLDRLTLRAATPVNLSDMVAVHFSAYKDATGGNASLEVGFRATNSEEVVYSTIVPQLKDDNWVYFNVPVAELAAAGLDVTSVGFIEFRGTGNVYIDNVFAYKGEYAEGLGEEPKYVMNWEEASKADALPDRNHAFLGVNLGNAGGGTVPGVLGQNYTYPTFQDLYYFKSKGVRLIRFPFKWERIQHELNGPLDNDLDFKIMKEFIAEAERLGMYVMPDMHNYCRRKVNEVTYKFGESATLTKEHFADVWTKIANELKVFDNIWGYDLMNEPYSLAPGVWFDAAQTAINGIRSVDTTTPIVVEGESYASASTWPTTGGKLINLVDPSNSIIFQAHTYFDRDKSGLYKLGEYDLEVASSTEHIKRIKPFVDWLKANNAKGILGEFGLPRNDVRWLKMLDEVLIYLKENGVSGTYWVAGANSMRDQLSVQPLDDFTVERAQMRILEKYIENFHETETSVFSVNGTTDKKVNIYPNPMIDRLIIDSDVNITTIEIFNISGQKVKSAQGFAASHEMNVEDLQKGTYLVRVILENGLVELCKLVKM